MRRSDLATRLGNITNYEAVRVTFTAEGKQPYLLLYEIDEGGWLERDLGNRHWTDPWYRDVCDRICDQISEHDYYDTVMITLVLKDGGNRIVKLGKEVQGNGKEI